MRNMLIATIIILISCTLIAYILGKMHGYDKGIEDEREITDREYFRRFKIENDYIRDEKKILAGAVSHPNTFRAKRGTNAYKRANRENKEFAQGRDRTIIQRIRRVYSEVKAEARDLLGRSYGD